MDKILATPGPTMAPPSVLKKLASPMAHHRTPEFEREFSDIREKLKLVFQTRQECMVHTSSGTGAMESLIVNLHSPGDKVICIHGGKFGERWAEMSKALGLEVLELSAPWGQSPAPQDLESLLASHPKVRSVMVQACETSTGQLHPIENYSAIVQKHGTLLLVDGITALGAYDLPMDTWKLDGLIGGSQKAFMSPTGLSLISLSERAWDAYKAAQMPRFYFDLGPERAAHLKNQTRFSSPVSLLKALGEALNILTEKGLEEHFKKIQAQAVFSRNLAQDLGLRVFPKNPSPSLSVFELPMGADGQTLRQWIEDSQGVVFMGGQDELQGRVLRWGHMGIHSLKDQETIGRALALGLQEFGINPTSEDTWTSNLKSHLEELKGALHG